MADEPLTPLPRDEVQDGDRLAAVARLRDVFANRGLSFEHFSTALELVLAASTAADLDGAMTAVPPIVRLTPASRRLRQPLVVEARLSSLVLGAGWQLGAETAITASTGSVSLDLAAASWDALDVDLRLEATTGTIKVIVPRGVAVQVVSARGQFRLDSLEPPIPGAPLLRVSAAASAGQIEISHGRREQGRKRGLLSPWHLVMRGRAGRTAGRLPPGR